MIIYDNRDARYIIFQTVGSVMLSRMVLLPAFFSSCLCVALLYITELNQSPFIALSTSVARIYGTILAFVVVFRTSMAFGRFFDGVSYIQAMFSKWRDAFTSLQAFIERSAVYQVKRGNSAAVEELMQSKARLLHWFTMLCAMAVQELQMSADPGADDDEDAGEDISPLCIFQTPRNRFKPRTGTQAEGDIPRKRGFAAALSGNANGVGRHGSMIVDRTSISSAAGPTLSEEYLNGTAKFLRPSMVPFDVYEAREAKRTSHRGSIDSSYGANSSDGNKSNHTKTTIASRMSVNSLDTSRMSMGNFMSADEVSDRAKMGAVFVIGDVTPQELFQISASHDHVLTVTKWILKEVTYQCVTGALLIGPPILSRVYQEVSNGMLAFSMARIKISVVPFPFPFAQVLVYALYAFYLFCPFIVVEIMSSDADEVEFELDQLVIPILLNFAACTGYAAVNEIAVELEMPFGFDANDYPVHGQQNIVVQTMEDVYFASAPTDFNYRFFSGEERLGRSGSMESCTASENGQERRAMYKSVFAGGSNLSLSTEIISSGQARSSAASVQTNTTMSTDMQTIHENLENPTTAGRQISPDIIDEEQIHLTPRKDPEAQQNREEHPEDASIEPLGGRLHAPSPKPADPEWV